MTAPLPNPGSHDAIQQGCVCPVYDNARGRRAPIPPDDEHPQGQWLIATDCPVHVATVASL